VVDFCELGAVHLPVQPMNAPLVPEPFDWPGWAYEEKYDGVRILAYKKEEGRSGCPPEMKKTEECYCHLTELQSMVSRLSASQNVEDTKDWSRKIFPLRTWKRAPVNG